MSSDALVYHPNIVIRDFKLSSNYDPDKHGVLEWSLSANQKGYYDTDLVYTDDFCSLLSSFVLGGKNIFHLEPELLDLFKKTSIDGVILEETVLPYNDFYIHFGSSSGIYAPHYLGDYAEPFDKQFLRESDNPIIGAYIHSVIGFDGINRGLDILLIPLDHGDHHWSHCIDLPIDDKQGYLAANHPNKNTILKIFHNDIYENPWSNDLVNHRITQKNTLGIDARKLKQEWVPSTGKQAWEEVSLEALKIIFNAILYLTSQDSDVEEDYPDSYPQKLVSKAKSDNSKESKRAESKLAAQGYTKIKFVGRSVKKYFQNQSSRSSVSSHWRRGHWRKQPYGPKEESKTRPVWIKPTIVNKNTADEKEMSGHIYEV